MTFRNDDGDDIEYEGKFAFTKQSISPLNGSIKGDVSINFSIDNNSYNRKVLGYYGPNATDQVAFSRLPFTRIKNNAILDRGYIVIQGEDDKLDCFYLSGNSNWVQLLQGYISELELSDYRTAWNITTIQESPTSGIIFCLADWIANGQRGSNSYSILAPYEVEDESHAMTAPQILPDFYPCFYLHTLVTEVMQEAGLKLAGSITDDPLYLSKVIGPESPLMTRDVTLAKITATGIAQNFTAGVEAKYTSFTETSDPDGLFANSTYTANKHTSLIFTIPLVIAQYSTTNYVVIKKNGVAVFYFNGFTSSIPVRTTHSIPVAPGDEIEFWGRRSTDSQIVIGSLTIYESSMIWPRDWVEPQFFLPKMKSIDLIKYLINFFCCSASFDQFSKTLTLNVIDKIKKEDAEDWSDKYINHGVDYSDINKNNFIKWAGAGLSDYISNYNRRTKLDFAHGNIETDKDTKEDGTIVTFPFSPAVVRENVNGHVLLNAPLAKLSNSTETLTYTSLNGAATNVTEYANIGGAPATEVAFRPHQTVKVFDAQKNEGISICSNITHASGNYTIRIYDENTFSRGTIKLYTLEYIKGIRIFTVKRECAPTQINAATMPVIWETAQNANSFDCTQKIGGQLAGNYTNITTFNWVSFTKPETGYPIDNFKNNLAIDNPEIMDTYKDPTIKELYYNGLTEMVKSPAIAASFLLSEVDFKNFKFDKFIFLKTERLTGYFFVTKIEGFVNSVTPVKTILLKV